MSVNKPLQLGEEMTEAESMSLLETKGHGVLSLAKDGSAYGIPVSFGYDDGDERFLIEFLSIGKSKKQQFATVTEEVTLTVYEFESTETWESAIVTGTFHQVDASDLSERAVSSFALQADDGVGEVRWAEADGLEREWYEIRPTSIVGRRRSGLGHES